MRFHLLKDGSPWHLIRHLSHATALPPSAAQDCQERRQILAPLRDLVLNTAKRFGKARFAQIARRIVAPLLWPHCLAGAILIFSIAFRELVGSVLLRPPGMQTVSTFILREFDQGSPAAGMAMGVIAISIAIVSVGLARRLVSKKP